MDVLSSRILLRPGDLDRSRRFYRDLLGLAVYREFGPPDDPGLASGSSWSRFLLITLSGVTRDRRYHRDDGPHAASQRAPPKRAGPAPPGMRL